MNVVTINAQNYLNMGAAYTNNLYKGIRENSTIDFDFTVFTDTPGDYSPGIIVRPLPHPLKGWWNKLTLFKRGVLQGRNVYFDLSCVIAENIDGLLQYRTEGPFLAALSDFHYPGKLQSSVMIWQDYPEIWDDYEREGFPILDGGDQAQLDRITPDAFRLQDKFDIQSYKVTGVGAVTVYHGHPKPHELGMMGEEGLRKGSVFESEKTRLENMQSSMDRGLPDMEAYQSHSGTWHVCAGGPSLRNEISKIKKAKGVIVSVNGTHDYLLSKKITPDVFVITDPQEHCEQFVKKPRKGIAYLVAAHCHPKVFDRLKGFDTRLWYPLDYELPVPVSIGGGSTVGLRAINIGYTLGYRDIHLWGFDGCVRGTHHAYPQDHEDDVKTVRYRGKDYQMTDWMCAQADNFDEMLRKHLDFKITVHSRGVIKHIGDYYASK